MTSGLYSQLNERRGSGQTPSLVTLRIASESPVVWRESAVLNLSQILRWIKYGKSDGGSTQVVQVPKGHGSEGHHL